MVAERTDPGAELARSVLGAYLWFDGDLPDPEPVEVELVDLCPESEPSRLRRIAARVAVTLLTLSALGASTAAAAAALT